MFRWRKLRNRTLPRFHCFQIMDRNLHRIHFSNRCNTEGVLPRWSCFSVLSR
jgi:hypothetical protein